MKNSIEGWQWRGSLSSGGIEFFHPSAGYFSKGTGRVYLNGIEGSPLGVDLNDRVYTLQFKSEVKLSVQIECTFNQLTLFPVLSNEGGQTLAIGDVELLDLKTEWSAGFLHAFINGKNMVENTGLVPLQHAEVSNSILGLTDADGTRAFVVGAIRPDDAWYDFSVSVDDGDVQNLKISCKLEDTLLAPHTSRVLSPIRFYSGTSLAQLMERYAEDVAEQMVPLMLATELKRQDVVAMLSKENPVKVKLDAESVSS